MESRTKRLRGLIPQNGVKDKEVERLDPTGWRQGQGGRKSLIPQNRGKDKEVERLAPTG